MTPPPLPSVPARKSSGNFSIFPSQSSITVSSSVQAGLAAYKTKNPASAYKNRQVARWMDGWLTG